MLGVRRTETPMPEWYPCPRCGNNVQVGQMFCSLCQLRLDPSMRGAASALHPPAAAGPDHAAMGLGGAPVLLRSPAGPGRQPVYWPFALLAGCGLLLLIGTGLAAWWILAAPPPAPAPRNAPPMLATPATTGVASSGSRS